MAVVLVLDADTLSENRVGGDPPIDASAIVANLKSRTLNRLDQMQILASVQFAKNNVTDFDRNGFSRNDSAELARFDLSPHRTAMRTKGNRFAGA